jgi:hypothetical protein
MQPGQALLDHLEEFARAVDELAGRDFPFDDLDHAGAVLLATGDQLLGLGEQEGAKNGERSDVHTASQEQPQRRLVPGKLGRFLPPRKSRGQMHLRRLRKARQQ